MKIKMRQIILAWLNANATNEVKANEIECHVEKYVLEVLEFYHNRLFFIPQNTDQLKYVIDEYKKENEKRN
jgi:hypothetical protein